MKSIICLLCICFSSYSWAQGIFRLPDRKPHSFHFELINNIVLVPVTINGIEFTFLLDTGVKETILFAQANDSLYLHNKNKMTFHGMGSGEGIEGLLSTDNVVKVGNVAIDTLHWIYVIQASDLDISSNIGVAINGILGSKFFNSFPIHIDYTKSKITLYPPGYDYSDMRKGYQKTAIRIENERPYIRAKIQVDQEWMEGKMLIDMGNTDPMMIFSFLLPHFTIKAPYVDEYLGRGINGAIYGKRNRVRKSAIAGFELAYPIVSYPNSDAIIKDRLTKNRIGSIGNQTLQRFHLFMDYAREEMYWKKNKWFKKPFLLNMAGMDVQHTDMIWTEEKIPIPRTKKQEEDRMEHGITIYLSDHHFQYNFVLKPQYKVAGVRKNSPAEKAGVQVDDILLKINGTPAQNLSLSKIMTRLQSHPGDEIRLTVQRGEEIKNIRFHLVDPIPYL